MTEIKGFIGYYKLEKWWLETFNGSQRAAIEGIFDTWLEKQTEKGGGPITNADLDDVLHETNVPGEGATLTTGEVGYNDLSLPSFLRAVARILNDTSRVDLRAPFNARALEIEEETALKGKS